MQAVKRVEGTGAPLDRTDVDTDAIIPAMCMKRVERTGFEDGLFFEWKKDPEFVLNQPEYQGASVLVAGANFGCGSSREHAAWALRDGGFRAVISPSFGDIFRENSLKVGLLAITLPTATVDTLLRAVERLPSLRIHIDVEALTVRAPSAGIDARFELDEFMRWRLLEGVDDIALTLTHDEALRATTDRATLGSHRYPRLGTDGKCGSHPGPPRRRTWDGPADPWVENDSLLRGRFSG